MGKREYIADIVDAAHTAGWTSAQVAEASFAQVKTAAGVSDPVPADFFWRQLRHLASLVLAREEETAGNGTKAAAILAKVKEIASHSNATVEVIRAGHKVRVDGPAFVVRRNL